MLYDFYSHENGKKPGSVHATFLLYGTQSAQTPQAESKTKQDGEDMSMTSSPPMSSMPQEEEDDEEKPPVKVMTLVRGENLESTALRHCHTVEIS